MLVFTSCVANYLPKARVLAKSIKRLHPDWHFRLLLGEEPPPGFAIEMEPFDRLMRYGELGIPDLQAFLFRHRLVEICTAVKGSALNYFLEVEKQDKVIYLDPDILATGSLEPLNEMLDKHDILLTPHQLAPQTGTQAIEDNEICSLRHGVFNLGFVAVANRPEGVAFSQFWRDRLARYCIDDKNRGLFTDQKWCDLCPAYFPSLGIVRDPGCNAASWNLTDRRISKNEKGEFLANGRPLRFYHFTGYDSGMGRVMSAAYGANMPAVAELWDLYDKLLIEAGQKDLGKSPWQGGFYSNGQPISDEARKYYRETPSIQALYPDPFLTDESGNSGFAGHWRKIKSREGNKLYVWARKPFRLLWLTHKYLKHRGGIKAAPLLFRATRNAWRQGGVKGVLEKIRRFKEKTIGERDIFRLDQLLKPANESLRQWTEILEEAFSDQNGVLVLDHMYGGGANDYREKRINEFLEQGRPSLLLAWNFFGSRLRLRFNLPGGRVLQAEATDISEVLQQDKFHFGHILLSELVLWSGGQPAPASHYGALPYLLHTILELKLKNKATLEIAVHDFYSICPNYHLLINEKEYCHVSKDLEKCRQCLASSPFDTPEDFDLGKWRRAWANAYDHADIIRVFSQATADILAECFVFKPGRLEIKPHSPLAPLPEVKPDYAKPLHIGVIGHIASHKGAEIVREIAALLQNEEKLTVIGALDGPAPENITETGDYQRDNLPALLNTHGINCCLAPSIWPETFCYVVQEIMQMNMPLVVFPLGAQAERVADYDKGRIAANISAKSALEALRKLKKDVSGATA